MAINFDGKGNIEATTEDGVIAVKLYSLEKQIEEKNKEIDRLNNKVSELENINEKIGLALDSAENKVDRLNNIIKEKDNIINELEKYIHNELVLDFYNDDMPCELIINKMEKMIKELKKGNK